MIYNTGGSKMRTTDFTQMVKELKETNSIKVKDLEKCTSYQLGKIENVLLDMHLDKNLNKVLDIVTDMIVSNTNTKVANKKNVTEKVVPVEQEEQVIKTSKKTQKTAPNKAVKPAIDEPTGMDYKAIKLGDIITIFNDSILDTHTTVVFKNDNLILTVDLDDNVSYEFKKDFIEDGGYVFKNKKYYLRLSSK